MFSVPLHTEMPPPLFPVLAFCSVTPSPSVSVISSLNSLKTPTEIGELARTAPSPSNVIRVNVTLMLFFPFPVPTCMLAFRSSLTVFPPPFSVKSSSITMVWVTMISSSFPASAACSSSSVATLTCADAVSTKNSMTSSAIETNSIFPRIFFPPETASINDICKL